MGTPIMELLHRWPPKSQSYSTINRPPNHGAPLPKMGPQMIVTPPIGGARALMDPLRCWTPKPLRPPPSTPNPTDLLDAFLLGPSSSCLRKRNPSCCTVWLGGGGGGALLWAGADLDLRASPGPPWPGSLGRGRRRGLGRSRARGRSGRGVLSGRTSTPLGRRPGDSRSRG